MWQTGPVKQKEHSLINDFNLKFNEMIIKKTLELSLCLWSMKAEFKFDIELLSEDRVTQDGDRKVL